MKEMFRMSEVLLKCSANLMEQAFTSKSKSNEDLEKHLLLHSLGYEGSNGQVLSSPL